MRKRTRLILIILAVVVIAGGIFGYILLKSQAPWARSTKDYVKAMLNMSPAVTLQSDPAADGLGEIIDEQLYENHVEVPIDSAMVWENNYRRFFVTEETLRYVNYPDGYLVDFPAGAEVDFSLSEARTMVYTDDFQLMLTRDYSPVEQPEDFFAEYLNAFTLDEGYREANRLTLVDHTVTQLEGKTLECISLVIEDMADDKFDGYTYITVVMGDQIYYRFLFKYDSAAYDSLFDQVLYPIADSLQRWDYFGTHNFDADFFPTAQTVWNEETAQLYNQIQNSDELLWGIFTQNVYTDGVEQTIPAMEQILDYTFDVLLSYVHFGVDFPTEFMELNAEAGRLVELTYQVTVSNNLALNGYTPMLDVYRGLADDTIRDFARQAKAFGKPFLFRLNNEMNSDWTSYSGLINLADPDIYIDVWRRFYDIFQEEGVDNAIWIFNPNDESYPWGCQWNHFACYYPGNDYVQLLGVTGYNTGTYYSEVNAEHWREFEDIYGRLTYEYQGLFDAFPWIITEFGSSSNGGDKALWIENMFRSLHQFPQIKIAVWFSYADFDPDYPGNSVVSRPYWLDETPETLEAFRKGVHGEYVD